MSDIKRYDPDTNFCTEIAELNAEVVRLRELLKIARCPHTSCLDGSIPHQISDDGLFSGASFNVVNRHERRKVEKLERTNKVSNK